MGLFFRIFINFKRLKMQSRGEPDGEQSCTFILFMIYAAHLSGNMLQQLGLLMTGKELMPMSPESRQSLLRKLAEQLANLTQNQRRKLIESRFRAVLVARLLGKQSWQRAPMRIPVDVLRHLMTKCIPRIRIAPIRMLEMPVKPAWQLTGSVVYDPSGYICSKGNWDKYHHRVIVIESHPNKPLVALMHSDGNVWIGKTGDPDNLFQQIHSSKNEAEKATAIAFHPSGNLIAVAILAQIIVYEISPALKPKLHFKASFYESGYFCPKSKFSANTLDWNPTGTFLTAISAGNLSMCFYLKPDTNEVIGGFNGGMKYAELCLFQENMSPSFSCFSVDGKLVVTGYSDGTIMARSAEYTPKTGVTLSCLKIMHRILGGQIDKIVPHPHNPSVFAIEVQVGWSHTVVLIVLVSHDGSVTITATIPDAKSPHFHEDWLLVSSGNRILFYKMDRYNIPFLVTEFHSQEIGTFCVKTTPDGKDMLIYSHKLGGSKLYMAAIKFK